MFIMVLLLIVINLWENMPALAKSCDVDTEALLAIVSSKVKKGAVVVEAVVEAFEEIEGNASIGLMLDYLDCIVLATNTGSLYYCQSEKESIFVFASERYILNKLIKKKRFSHLFSEEDIDQLSAGQGYIIDTKGFSFSSFSLGQRNEINEGDSRIDPILDIINWQDDGCAKGIGQSVSRTAYPDDIDRHYCDCKEHVDAVKRCSKCVLPETVPFIEFDDEGVCNYCYNHEKIQYRGKDVLFSELDRYRKKENGPNCIVSLSGGRDSCYALHYLKNECNMRPIAYTYDWGMVTDLARRNSSRMCGKLGVEHIIVSADIVWKRNNIKKNVEAWLQRPQLGTIPLFMAGDKQYYYYANQIKSQTGIDFLIMAENKYEKTNFKTGFCGIREKKNRPGYDLSLIDQLRLVSYYGKAFISNPRYLNASLLDSLWAFYAYYSGSSHNYINLFQYFPWEEKQVTSVLLEDYNWEIATDTSSTWRIGDGTAAFYNYIYYIVAGFTENDTFRSNQVREGILDRDEALVLVQKENYPSL